MTVCHRLASVRRDLEDAALFCFNGDLATANWQVPIKSGK
jgi:hypothetical protein